MAPLTIDEIVAQVSIMNLQDDSVLLMKVADGVNADEYYEQIMDALYDRIEWDGVVIMLVDGATIEDIEESEQRLIYEKLKEKFEGNSGS